MTAFRLFRPRPPHQLKAAITAALAVEATRGRLSQPGERRGVGRSHHFLCNGGGGVHILTILGGRLNDWGRFIRRACFFGVPEFDVLCRFSTVRGMLIAENIGFGIDFRGFDITFGVLVPSSHSSTVFRKEVRCCVNCICVRWWVVLCFRCRQKSLLFCPGVLELVTVTSLLCCMDCCVRLHSFPRGPGTCNSLDSISA